MYKYLLVLSYLQNLIVIINVYIFIYSNLKYIIKNLKYMFNRRKKKKYIYNFKKITNFNFILKYFTK